MSTVFIISFRDQPQRHGGVKRSAQLNEALGELGAETVSLKRPNVEQLKSCLFNPLRTVRHIIRAKMLFFFRGVTLTGAIKYVLMAATAEQEIRRLKPALVYIETSTGQGILTMDVLRRLKIPYLAMPQNIEFMVPGGVTKTFRSLSASVRFEIEGFKNAVHVKTICNFDAAVLQCFGIEASEFPAFPDEKDASFYRDIQQERTRSEKQHYLVLGTANNPPTFAGMKRLVDELETVSLELPVLIAGFGTEKLPKAKNPQVKLLGSVDDEKLRFLLVHCKAIIVRQPQTTGMLTKLPECNIADIPVFIIGRYMQAQGLQHAGIHCIDSFADIRKIDVASFKKMERPSATELKW